MRRKFVMQARLQISLATQPSIIGFRGPYGAKAKKTAIHIRPMGMSARIFMIGCARKTGRKCYLTPASWP